jgi:hypothetical protein
VPSFEGVSFGRDGLALVLDVSVEVPQLPGFALETLAWTVEVSGHDLGRGGLRLEPPQGGLRRALNLRTRWDPRAAVGAAWTTWRTGAFSLGLAFSGSFATPFGAVPISGHPTFSTGDPEIALQTY